jgi:hypothetical protein
MMSAIALMVMDLPSPASAQDRLCKRHKGSSLVRRLLLLLFISSLFAGPALADALTGREIQRAIIGHTWAWKSQASATSGVVTYHRDGRMFLSIENGRPQGGRWRIDGNKLCTIVIGGNENCYKDIVKVDTETFLFESSKTTYKLAE